MHSKPGAIPLSALPKVTTEQTCRLIFTLPFNAERQAWKATVNINFLSLLV